MSRFARLALAAALLLRPAAVVAQFPIGAPDCLPGWDWTFNTLLQNPCKIASYLEATCNEGQFSIPSLPPGGQYAGYEGRPNLEPCQCSSVVYNLLSACELCQGSTWPSWPLFSANCTREPSPGTFPNSIPSNTTVPRWAYLDTTQNGTWNNLTAFATGDAPESTGSVPITTPTAPLTPPPSSGNTPPPTGPAQDTHHSSHAGAIAGGVVGGVVGAALLGGLLAWALVRRRRQHAAQGASLADQPAMEQAAPPIEPYMIYNPSDPRTFPPSAGSLCESSPSPPRPLNGRDMQFRGLPEI